MELQWKYSLTTVIWFGLQWSTACGISLQRTAANNCNYWSNLNLFLCTVEQIQILWSSHTALKIQSNTANYMSKRMLKTHLVFFNNHIEIKAVTDHKSSLNELMINHKNYLLILQLLLIFRNSFWFCAIPFDFVHFFQILLNSFKFCAIP